MNDLSPGVCLLWGLIISLFAVLGNEFQKTNDHLGAIVAHLEKIAAQGQHCIK